MARLAAASPLTCRRCKTAFKTKTLLQNHKKLNKCFWRPSGVAKIPCPFCAAKFSYQSTAEKHVKRKHISYVRSTDGQLRQATRGELVGRSATGQEFQRIADKVVPPQLRGMAFNLTSSRKKNPSASLKKTLKRGTGRQTLEPLRRVFPCEACDHVSASFDEAKSHRMTHIEEDMSDGSSTDTSIQENGPVLRSQRRALRGRRALGFRTVGSAHGQQLQRFRYIFPPRVHFMEAAFAHVMPRLAKVLHLQLAANRGLNLKCTIVLNVEMVQINEEGEIEEEMEVPFRGGMRIIHSKLEVTSAMQAWMDKIDMAFEEFLKRGSGWTLNDVNFLDLEVFRVAPLQGACHLHTVDYKKGHSRFIDPPSAADAIYPGHVGGVKRILLGVRNEKEAADPRLTDCFYLAIARACLGSEDFDRASVRHRFILDKLDNFKKRRGQNIRECDLSGFEEAHSNLHLAINVLYQNEEGTIFPLRPSDKNADPDAVVIVLMLRYFAKKKDKEKEDNNEPNASLQGVGHYAYVSDPVSLLAVRKGRRLSDNEGRADEEVAGKDDEGKGKGGSFTTTKLHPCYNCFNFFYRTSTYASHIRWCHQKSGQAVIMPEPKSTVSFDNKKGKSFLAAYTIFFDFETYGKPPPNERHACRCTEAERRRADGLPPLDGDRDAPDQAEEEDVALLIDAGLMKKKDIPYKSCPHKTRVLNEQRAFAYSLAVVNRHNKVVEQESYSGDDAAEMFLARLLDLERKYLLDYLQKGKGAPITAETLAQAGPRPTNNFHPCYICDAPLMGDVVLDHDHVDGSFVGWAHNACNLHRKEVMKLPVMAHNFSSFDGHLIMREVPKVRPRGLSRASASPYGESPPAPPRYVLHAGYLMSGAELV
jgi:hypothetical protein